VTRWAEIPVRWDYAAVGGVSYFIAIGLGFMLTEMATMQQVSLFLGHPIYSLVVVLTGLTLSTGIGSLASERLRLDTNVHGRVPAIVSAAIIVAYSVVVLPLIHSYAYLALPYRVAISLALLVPIGFALGFCFPVGLRWMTKLGRDDSLPWMWALNGAASVVAGFLAIIVSMEASITVSVLFGAGLQLVGARDRNNPRLLSKQPGECDLSRRRPLPFCDPSEQINQRPICLPSVRIVHFRLDQRRTAHFGS